MKYWVRLDKQRIMEDFDMQDLLESPLDSMYLILQLRFLIEKGTGTFSAEEEDILHDQAKVKLTDSQGRSVYTPCIVITSVCEA